MTPRTHVNGLFAAWQCGIAQHYGIAGHFKDRPRLERDETAAWRFDVHLKHSANCWRIAPEREGKPMPLSGSRQHASVHLLEGISTNVIEECGSGDRVR